MNKNHRKDVIIARLIFAGICILLIAVIASIVVRLHSNGADTDSKKESSQTENQNLPPNTQNSDLPPVTENPEESASDGALHYVWTNTAVNLREQPNTNCSVITVLDARTQLELLGEEEGWVKVSYNGQEGYVSTDYISDDNPSDNEGE
jgi:uncharacterized protein YgiM (DUF1202 family)